MIMQWSMRPPNHRVVPGRSVALSWKSASGVALSRVTLRYAHLLRWATANLARVVGRPGDEVHVLGSGLITSS